MSAKTRWRQSRAPSRSPLRQGALDGLCGVYSIVNALRLLCRELDRNESKELFHILMQSLDGDRRKGLKVACWGMSGVTLSRLLLCAVNHMQEEFGIEISLGKMPSGSRHNANLETLWTEFGRRIDEGAVPVIGLFGRHEHWTVAFAISEKYLKLFDSDGMRILRRAACTTGQARRRYGIRPRDVYFLYRLTSGSLDGER